MKRHPKYDVSGTPDGPAIGKRINELLLQNPIPYREIEWLSRLWLLWMFFDLQDLRTDFPGDPLRPSRRLAMIGIVDRLKAFRFLIEVIASHEKHKSPRDHLDLDGAGFRYVFRKVTEWMSEAMSNAGAEESTAEQVMEKFRDIVTRQDEQTRRGIDPWMPLLNDEEPLPGQSSAGGGFKVKNITARRSPGGMVTPVRSGHNAAAPEW